MSGLLTARVLADHFERVTIIDRDALPDEHVNRRGVPQGRHVHVLLAGGSNALESVFPGILRELRTSGAVVLDDGDLSKGYWSFGGHVMPRSGRGKDFDPTLDGLYQASRPFLELHVRRRVAKLPNVAITIGPGEMPPVPAVGAKPGQASCTRASGASAPCGATRTTVRRCLCFPTPRPPTAPHRVRPA